MRLNILHPRLGLAHFAFMLLLGLVTSLAMPGQGYAGGGSSSGGPADGVTSEKAKGPYYASFYEVKNPVTGETLYVQRISRVAIFGNPEGASDRLRYYQRLAVDHIAATLNDEDRRVLEEHRSHMPLPDGMIIVSRAKNFQEISPQDIVGTIAISDEGISPANLEYRPYITGDDVLQKLANNHPLLHVVDGRRTVAHFTSADRDLTALTVSLGEMLLFNDGLYVRVPDDATVKIDTSTWPKGAEMPRDQTTGVAEPVKETMSMADFRRRFGASLPTGAATDWLQPDGYQLDAFDRLRPYYEERGFKLDETAGAHGNLRHYTQSRPGLIHNWIEKIVRQAPSGKIVSWSRRRAIRRMSEKNVAEILAHAFRACVLPTLEGELH